MFYGTLHGLETAVKVIVHRGKGEPLAYDAGDPWVAADGGECAGEGQGGDAAAAPADAGGEGNGEISRIRKVVAMSISENVPSYASFVALPGRDTCNAT